MSRCIRDLKEMVNFSRINGSFNPCLIINEQYVQAKTINSRDDKTKNSTNLEKFNDSSWIEIEKYLAKFSEKAMTEWLENANESLSKLTELCHNQSFYLHFCDFWLTSMTASRKTELIQLEYAIVCSTINSSITVSRRDCTEIILSRIFWEYPVTILSKPHFFIDKLEVISSSNKSDDAFRAFMSDLRNVPLTSAPTTLQCCLSLRAFCLVSVWHAVVLFYRQLLDRGDASMTTVSGTDWSGVSTFERVNLAIELDLVAALEYLLQREKISIVDYRDSQSRTLIHIAVGFQSVKIAQFLLSQPDCSRLVNVISEAGNTPLHMAVCHNSLSLARLLLDTGNADVEAPNLQSDQCTPLHMAAIYGHLEVAQYLIKHGASTAIRTESGFTLEDLASAHDQTSILNFLATLID